MHKMNMHDIHRKTVKLSHGKCRCISTGKYNDQFQSLWFKCNHGHTFEKTWHSFQQRPRCPTCARKGIGHKGHHFHRWNDKTVGKYIHDVTNGHYKYAPDRPYQSTKKKIRIIHMKPLGCGRAFHMTFDKFKRGERCPWCRYKSIRLTRPEIVKKADKLTHNQYTLLTKTLPKKADGKLLWKHKKCGTTFRMTWNTFNDYHQYTRCPTCSKNPHKKLNFKIISKKINTSGGGYYKLRFDLIKKYHLKYSSNLDKVLPIKHLKCGTTYWTRWSDWKSGHRCPTCSSSHGEAGLRKQFRKYHIKYINPLITTAYASKRSKQLNKPVHVDIYSPKYKLGIEYDGIEHNVETDFFQHRGGIKGLIHRDRVTSKWCAKHGIILMRLKSFARSYRKPQRMKIRHFMVDYVLPTIHMLKRNPNNRKWLIKIYNSQL